MRVFLADQSVDQPAEGHDLFQFTKKYVGALSNDDFFTVDVPTLNLGCIMIYIGVYIEKGMGLVIPGLTPDTLGEIYEYFPSNSEIMISAGIFSIGFLLFTLMVKVATPIMLGEFRLPGDGTAEPEPAATEVQAVAPN